MAPGNPEVRSFGMALWPGACPLVLSLVLSFLAHGLAPVTAQSGPSDSAPSDSVRDGQVEASLIVAESAVVPGAPFTAAVRLKMDPKWHTYWVNPGDSGMATRLAWNLPQGFTAGPIQWPTPERVDVGGIISYAYHDEVWLLTEITPPPEIPAESIRIGVDAKWLMCEEVCIPGKASLSLSLPVAEQSMPDPERLAAVGAARATLPGPGDELGWQARFAQAGDAITLVFELPVATATLSDAYFFPNSSDQVQHEPPQRLEAAGPGVWRIGLMRSETAPETLEELAGILQVTTETGETLAAHIQARPGTVAATESPVRGEGAGLWLEMMVSAFFGGILLNIMPCVLPVITLKLLSLVKQAGETPGAATRHGLAYAAGIVVSFLVLAGVMLALRAGGERVGWGFQFQSPVFLAVMSGVVLVVALALFDVIIIGSSLGSVGAGLEAQGGLQGSFFGGVFATTVATPCTAPLMAPAIGFALFQPAALALGIFGMLGVGMALPFLVLAVNPGWLRWMPRPGAWMVIFKEAAGFAMLGLLLYLMHIYGAKQGATGIVGLGIFLLAVALGCWIVGRFGAPVASSGTRATAWTTATACAVLGWWMGVNPAAATIPWQPWSPEAQRAALESGRPVFVDFTAEWCLTCKINERVALDRAATAQLFAERQVVPLKADWTSSDPAITAELERFERSGVPLYVFYPAGAPRAPVILPQLLTPDLVARVVRGEEG